MKEARSRQSGGAKRINLSERARTQRYDDLIYGIVVRSVFDLAQYSELSRFKTVAINVRSHFKSPSTGLDTDSVVASVLVAMDDVRAIDPLHINPTETFRTWKGVAAKFLSEMVPIQPVVVFNKNDERLVEGRDILSQAGETQNLAAMDWDDFEHLVRQLFELEFKSANAEVKVTRSSRDRGVDAIIYDPDPIRGGKIVVQAKRYTNTVDVSSVRDLYGTVQSEGANRGILVTTSGFGPDARVFATGKPLSLIDGANLLALLQKHGFHFQIDLRAARHNRQSSSSTAPPDE
jgi:restriction system protein